jgi:hypothetical protein
MFLEILTRISRYFSRFSLSSSTKLFGAFSKNPTFESLPLALAISLSTFLSSSLSLAISLTGSTSSPSGT